MLAMSHVCSLQQKIEYSNDIAPNSVADWDRKTWSFENYFGVSVDVGNSILATMFLAIRHSLGMEAPIDPHQQGAPDNGGSQRPAPWTDPRCVGHPIISGAATTGMARKEGYVQSVANLARRGITPAECLHVVIETLIQDEVDHQVSLLTQLTDATCEALGDVLEAAGGPLCPYTPAAKPFMMSMHAAHEIDSTHDGNAFRSLQTLAQSIKKLANMIPKPRSRDGTPGDNSACIWAILNEIRPDNLVLDQRCHTGRWICGEISRLGGDSLLNEEGPAPAVRDVRGRRRRKSAKFPPKLERGRSRARLVDLKARKAWARDKSRGRSPTRIMIRTPPIILDTRLHETQNKGTYRCDECEQLYYGPSQGEFIKGARDLTYDDIASGWKHGTIDASWFCVDCWQEKLGLDSNEHTRETIGLPAASRPAEITNNRFHQHRAKWSICDNCEAYCTGRARDYLPGSFVYASDNTLAGPPKSRKGCFPTLHYRERTCGETDHGTPDTSAERASCGSGTGHLTRLTSGWRCTIQDQKGQRTTTSGGNRAARGQVGTANGTGHPRATDGTTDRASDLVPPAHLSTRRR